MTLWAWSHLRLEVGLCSWMHIHHTHLHRHGYVSLVHEAGIVVHEASVEHRLLHAVSIHVHHVYVVPSDHIGAWLDSDIGCKCRIDSDIWVLLTGATGSRCLLCMIATVVGRARHGAVRR